MPNTMTKITSATIVNSGVNVSISNIPQTFTDLYILISGRTDVATTVGTLALWFNNDGSNLNSFTQLFGTGTTTSTGRGQNTFPSAVGNINGANSNANIYTNISIYIPHYRNTSSFKTAIVQSAQENNTTSANMYQTGVLYRSTNAITVVSLNGQQSALGFLAPTTVSVYGINNTF